MAQTKTDTTGNIKAQLRDPKTGRVVANRSTATLPLLEALDNAVKAVRAQHLELPQSVIVLGAPGVQGRTRAHGVFSANRWDAQGKPVHEIKLGGESLQRGALATFGTLLHELTHSIAYARGVKDTSREGRYHNTRFRALADEMGIEVSYDKQIGWSLTEVPKATQVLYKAELREIAKSLKAYRLPDAVGVARKTVKIACECRSVTVPESFLSGGIDELNAVRYTLLTCNLCNSDFEEVQR